MLQRVVEQSAQMKLFKIALASAGVNSFRGGLADVLVPLISFTPQFMLTALDVWLICANGVSRDACDFLPCRTFVLHGESCSLFVR